VFVIACSNVANLILARSVRRDGELAVRAALGATTGALRRTLLAESLVLCGAGAVLGMALAGPLVTVIARFASRFSVRALEVTVDPTVLWVGAGLALASAVLLAYVPRLPSSHAPTGLGLTSGSIRITPATNRRLRVFATIQIAFTFVLLAAAGTLMAAVIALQAATTGYDMKQVLAVDLPTSAVGQGDANEMAFYQEMTRRIDDLPGVTGVALGSFVPWRDAGTFPRFQFRVEGYTPQDGEEDPHARLRIVGPGFFSVVGAPVLAGREFTDDDRGGHEPVVIVSQSLAARLFPNGEALNRKFWWTETLFGPPLPRRIVGIAPDLDDENVVPGTALTVYHPVFQMRAAGRMFVHAQGDPYAVVPAMRHVIHGMKAEQAIERVATLEHVRAEVLAPERLNAFVVAGFAGVALLIAVVGVAGVLAFSVSARTREFGIRLAVGSSPRRLLWSVLSEGVVIVLIGVAAGAAGAYTFAGMAESYVGNVGAPGALTILGVAGVLVGSALVASLTPAARASRVDVLRALKSE
jgi:predicted permease